MYKKEKPSQEIELKDNMEMRLPEFYETLKNAIKANNKQSVYRLSKIFNTRYCFKE